MLNLEWDNLSIELKEQILSDACVNTRYAHYNWGEIESWLKDIITDNLKQRSHNSVTIS